MRGFFPRTTYETLTEAVIAGQIKGVHAALAAGANPNRPDILGDTAVLWAAALGEIHVLRVLLENGGDPARINAQGDTLWHAAARSGHAAVFEEWPTPPDQVDRLNHLGETVWDLALQATKPDLAQVLAQQGPGDRWAHCPEVAAKYLHHALPRPAHVKAVLAAGGAVGWDTALGTLGTPWSKVLLRCPDYGINWRPEGAPVLKFHRRRRP